MRGQGLEPCITHQRFIVNRTLIIHELIGLEPNKPEGYSVQYHSATSQNWFACRDSNPNRYSGFRSARYTACNPAKRIKDLSTYKKNIGIKKPKMVGSSQAIDLKSRSKIVFDHPTIKGNPRLSHDAVNSKFPYFFFFSVISCKKMQIF